MLVVPQKQSVPVVSLVVSRQQPNFLVVPQVHPHYHYLPRCRYLEQLPVSRLCTVRKKVLPRAVQKKILLAKLLSEDA